jgi:RimJ/RimL family protein N-acetyltransferase
MKKIILKNEKEMIIRKATRLDALRMVQYVSVIGGESNNLTFGLNEFELTKEKEELIIENTNSMDNSIMIIAEIDSEIVSMVSMHCGTRPRTRHVGEFGITVRKPYWGLGIGSAMLDYLIEWAKGTNIVRKINLKVRSDNSKAIALYKKHGFTQEGVSTRDLYINGEFHDCIIMGLEID